MLGCLGCLPSGRGRRDWRDGKKKVSTKLAFLLYEKEKVSCRKARCQGGVAVQVVGRYPNQAVAQALSRTFSRLTNPAASIWDWISAAQMGVDFPDRNNLDISSIEGTNKSLAAESDSFFTLLGLAFLLVAHTRCSISFF